MRKSPLFYILLTGLILMGYSNFSSPRLSQIEGHHPQLHKIRPQQKLIYKLAHEPMGCKGDLRKRAPFAEAHTTIEVTATAIVRTDPTCVGPIAKLLRPQELEVSSYNPFYLVHGGQIFFRSGESKTEAFSIQRLCRNAARQIDFVLRMQASNESQVQSDSALGHLIRGQGGVFHQQAEFEGRTSYSTSGHSIFVAKDTKLKLESSSSFSAFQEEGTLVLPSGESISVNCILPTKIQKTAQF